LGCRDMIRASRMNLAAFLSASVNETSSPVPRRQIRLPHSVAGLQIAPAVHFAHALPRERADEYKPARDRLVAIHGGFLFRDMPSLSRRAAGSPGFPGSPWLSGPRQQPALR
jgi:hypothetical protein